MPLPAQTIDECKINLFLQKILQCDKTPSLAPAFCATLKTNYAAQCSTVQCPAGCPTGTHCENNACVPDAPTCGAAGDTCTFGDDCCSNNCEFGQCI